MLKRCPYCDSLNVRRSVIRRTDAPTHHFMQSPYRCRDCRKRFWIVTSRTTYLAAFVVVSIILVGGSWLLWQALSDLQARTQSQSVMARTADKLELAKRGDPAAEYEVYRMYLGGEGVPRNDSEARTWLRRSAEHGNAEAQYELAMALHDGRGVVQDYERALKWMQAAASNGHAPAQYGLGLMYRNGVGIPPDLVKAYIWLNLAAAQGFEGAIPLRDTVLSRLTPEELMAAQSEARRMGDTDTAPK